MGKSQFKIILFASLILALLIASLSVFLIITHAAHATPRTAFTVNTAEDNFQRANLTGGWGTTSNTDGLTNYAWNRSLGNSTYCSIQSNAGAVAYTMTNGHKVAGYLATTPQQSGDVLARVTFSNVGGAEGGVNLDNNTTGTQWYQVDINTYLKTLEIRKRLNGIMTTVESLPFTFTANTPYWLRIDVQVSGGVASVNGKVWQYGTAEPTSWMISYTDPTPLPAGYPGAMGDWFQTPPAGTLTRFTSWSYAATGLAVPAGDRIIVGPAR